MRYHPSVRAARALAWRVFDRRCGREIETRLRYGQIPCCPQCGLVLEARPATRLRPQLILDASGYDLDCRDCRRFWCVVRHTPRSLRLMRMRRFVAAVRAAGRRARELPRKPEYSRPAAVA
jgi:hypothetical protein